MKPRSTLLVSTLLVGTLGLAASAAATAQTRADFSGKWVLDAGRSGPETRGISPEVSFPTELIVKQTATELQLQTSTERQDTHTFIYRLDGTISMTTLPDGTVVTGRAVWEGPNVVITSKRVFSSPALGEFVSELREVYSVAADTLTVRRTQVTDGVTLNGTAVYAKTTPQS